MGFFGRLKVGREFGGTGETRSIGVEGREWVGEPWGERGATGAEEEVAASAGKLNASVSEASLRIVALDFICPFAFFFALR